MDYLDKIYHNNYNMPKLYLISWVLGDFRDISNNMIRTILESEVIFVEEIPVFEFFLKENNIDFKWQILEISHNENPEYKNLILKTFLEWKNVWVFESSGIPFFVDPGLYILQFVYKLKSKVNVEIVYIPWGSALTAGLSLCGFDIDKFSFLWFVSQHSKNEVYSSSIPVVYFVNHCDVKKLSQYLGFMKDLWNREAFIGINIAKRLWENGDIIIRGKWKNVYTECIEKVEGFLEKSEIPDILIVFNWIDGK
jgi:16S rRNA C1402 (ribose-2'-O) methylase RsmI